MTTSPIHAYLADLHARHARNAAGEVADYIPELTHADPEWFGICIATRDGIVYEVGDTEQPFTIQSVSKPFTYGLALADRGEEAVLAKIGVEPSGDAFNAISLRPQTGAPMNPLINAGAIAACGLVRGDGVDGRIARILETFGRFAGRALDVDERVYASESATGHRNRAIGWMLRTFGVLPDEPTPTLETYFRQCAIRVTCRDLAIMGATLANGGVNPVTGERALDAAFVDNVLSVMATCGMYDFSGEWLYQTGLPAKSGVGGGILAVQPARLGIGVFSPRLDEHGNSVRGIAVCRELAADLGLHIFDVSRRPAPVMRLTTTRRTVASSRRRPKAAADYLHGVGNRLRLYQLQGALVFAAVEPVIRELMARAETADAFIVNLRSVQSLDGAAARLLARTHATLGRPRQDDAVHRGQQLVGHAHRGGRAARRVLRRRRFRARVRRERAARQALSRGNIGTRRWSSRNARCSRASTPPRSRRSTACSRGGRGARVRRSSSPASAPTSSSSSYAAARWSASRRRKAWRGSRSSRRAWRSARSRSWTVRRAPRTSPRSTTSSAAC